MPIRNAMTTVSILHITMKLVKTPTKQPYRIDYSLVKGLYKITTESIKLVLDVEQFDGVASYLSTNYAVHVFMLICTNNYYFRVVLHQ